MTGNLKLSDENQPTLPAADTHINGKSSTLRYI